MRTFALLLVVLAACGGDSGAPIESGSVSGSYKGTAFTPKFGFATVYQGTPLLGLATSGVGCGSENMSSPPGGHGIIISGFTYTASSFASATVQIFENAGGNYSSYGSTGTLTLTDINDTTIAGSVMFTTTNSDNETYSASGDFVIDHCPQ
ncbi:MAG TPA: hypothetical protein VGM90_08065 [Kofleriaceae bacterium]|jgi:hypothetical protein